MLNGVLQNAIQFGKNMLGMGDSGNPLDDQDEWRRILGCVDTQNQNDKSAYDKFVELYKTGQFKLNDDSQARLGASANLTFSYTNQILALFSANAPDPQIEVREGSEEADRYFLPAVMAGAFPDVEAARMAFAESMERTLKYSYEYTNSDIHQNAALFDGELRGLGVVKESFDPVTGLDRIEQVRRCDFYVDPAARFSLDQARYVVQICEMPIAEARAFFASKNYHGEIEPNWTLYDGQTVNDTARAREGNTKQDMYRFYEAWIKVAAMPQENKIKYFDAKNKSFLFDTEWPFLLRPNDFPYSVLCFNQQFNSMADPFPAVMTVEGLRNAYEDSVEYLNRHTRRSIAKKIAFDQSVWSPDCIRMFMDGKDLSAIPLKDLGDKKIEDTFMVINLLENGAEEAIKLGENTKGIYDAILGLDEILRGAEGKDMTATEAKEKADYSKLRIGRKQKILDAFLADQFVKRAMIQRQLLDPQKVKCIVGEKDAFLWKLYAGNHEDLLNEYSITVAAGSTGESARDEKLKVLDLLYEKGMQLNAIPGPMGMPQQVVDVVQVLKDAVELKNLRAERYFPKQDENAMQQPGMMPPQAQTMNPMQPQVMQQPVPQGTVAA